MRMPPEHLLLHPMLRLFLAKTPLRLDREGCSSECRPEEALVPLWSSVLRMSGIVL